MPRTGLCGHCNRLRLKLKAKEDYAAKFQKEAGGLPYPLIMSFDLRVLRRMVEDAKAEGRIYGGAHKEEITGLKLEHELDLLGKRFVRKDFFHGDATWLAWSFCPDHRRFVFYVLSLFNREYMRRNRRRRAAFDEILQNAQ